MSTINSAPQIGASGNYVNRKKTEFVGILHQTIQKLNSTFPLIVNFDRTVGKFKKWPLKEGV